MTRAVVLPDIAKSTRALLVQCLDGPLAGESFTVTRCPMVVRCVLGGDGTADILNEPGDTPRLDEAVHWYRWNGRPVGHVCSRAHGCMSIVHLTHAPQLRELRKPDPINPGAAHTKKKEKDHGPQQAAS